MANYATPPTVTSSLSVPTEDSALGVLPQNRTFRREISARSNADRNNTTLNQNLENVR
jgi:hypothetical protein